MTNGQQRPANPNRLTVWHAKPFPDGRPATSEFSVNVFISLELLKQLYDAIGSGLIAPEENYQGVRGIQLWGNGYRGNPNGPVLGGTINTPKAIYQAQQAAQQQPVDTLYPSAFPPAQQAPQAAQQQVDPAYAEALPPAQAAPQEAPQAAPARVTLPGEPAPVPQRAPVKWGQQAAPAGGNQWATQQVPDL